MQLRKQVLPLLLLVGVLVVAVPFVAAQTSRVKVDGSPILFVFSQTSGMSFADQTATEVLVNISGTDAAFAALCANELDIASSDRPITDEELAACAANGVQVVELEIAQDGVAVYSNNAEQTCYGLDELATVFGAEGPAVVGRAREYQTYLADALGLDALRDDFVALPDDLSVGAALADASAETVGMVSLLGALGSGEAPLAIDGGEGCVAPSTATIADGSYPLAGTLFMYVSVGSGEQLAVAGYVDYLLSAENLGRLTQVGLLPLSEETYSQDLQNWQLRTPGRTFTALPVVVEEIDYSLAVATPEGADLTLAAGSGEIMAAAQQVVDELTAGNPDLRYQLSETSTDAAIMQLCNGEIDMVGARRPITDAELAACAASDIEFMELLVGINPLVVVTNLDNEFASCITPNTLNLMFGAASEGTIVRWEQMREGYPPYDLAVYVPDGPAAASFQEMLGPNRADVTRGDVVNAVRIDPTGVGYVGFGDYVSAEGRIKGLSLDTGAGCISPTAEAIQSGAYPLTQALYLYVNGEAMARPAVQVLAGELLGGNALPAAGYLTPPSAQYAQMVEIFNSGTLGPVVSRGAE